MTTTLKKTPGRERSNRGPSPLWAPDRRGPTIGIVLLVTLAAFEDMGVNTAMPRIVADLHGGALYSWPFVAFLAASVAACVLSGRLCDRRGPATAMFIGPSVFVVGLLVSGTAQNMGMLLAGRTLQGLGAGTQIVAVTVMVGLIYPERDRPAAYGALSTAWVVPALIGPAISGLVTEHLSWRAVFLGLVPLVCIGLAVLVPVLRRLPARPADTPSLPARRGLSLAAVGAAGGLSALSWAANNRSPVALGIAVVAVVALVPSLRTLMPAGTFRARRGLPTAILARVLLAGAYFAAIAYVPLVLTSVHHFSPATAGLPLTVGALGWSLAALWQSRHPDIERGVLLRTGFVLLAVGLAVLALVAPAWGPSWLALVALPISGAGMGLATSSASLLTLSASTDLDRGFNSSAMQIGDLVGQVIMVSIGGILINAVASTAHPTAAVLPLDLFVAALALLGVVITGRRAQSAPPAA